MKTQIKTGKVKRPLLRYFGGKWQLRHWIISFLPKHRFYAEPFAGAASILLGKERAPGGEIINDLNGDIINLFRVMQDKMMGDELERRLGWTIYSKSELEFSRQAATDPIERARRMVVRSFMAIELAGTRSTRSGFRMGNVELSRRGKFGGTFRNTGRDWKNWRLALPAIRERLSDVMLYERDGIEFIGMMNDPECLLYVDPPYHLATRTRGHGGSRYRVEFTPAEHDKLVECLLASKSMIVLSGYPHEAYKPLTESGWRYEFKDYRANMSLNRRTEALWISPNAMEEVLQFA